MNFLAQTPPRDPIQTLQPQFFSNISCIAPTPPQYTRAYLERIQRTIDLKNWSRSDVSVRPIASRKRSRIEVKEDHIRPSIDQSVCYQRDQSNNNIKINFNDSLPRMGNEMRKNQLSCDGLLDRTYEIPRKSARLIAKSPGADTKPSFDEFSRRLGVGWSSVLDSDQDVQAAVRGWANFIENHFPISNVIIRLRSKGLGCFLVEANEGYFLFGDDLKQGKLVSKNLENVWTNLQGSIPVFEGETLHRLNERSTIHSQTELKNSEISTTRNHNTTCFDHTVPQKQCF